MSDNNLTITAEDVLRVAREHPLCAPVLEDLFPSVFKQPAQIDLSKLRLVPYANSFWRIFTEESYREALGCSDARLLEIRRYGKYAWKGFWLDSHFNWELLKDPDALVLVPTVKKVNE